MPCLGTMLQRFLQASLFLFMCSLGSEQTQIRDDAPNHLTLQLEEAIRREFSKLTSASELNINSIGNDITPALADIIKVGDALADVEQTLSNAGFSIHKPSHANVAGKRVDYVFAMSTKILGSEGESLSSVVTIRLIFDDLSPTKKITRVIASIITTEL
jgi:hypothetical protein